MKANYRRVILISLGVVLLLIIVLLQVGGYMMRTSDDSIQETFTERDIPVDVVYDTIYGEQVRLVMRERAESDSVLVLFVHGAPGGWDAWKKYMLDDTMHVGHMVAYDRPGYGGSSSRSMSSIVEQMDVLASIVERYKLPKVVLVGHSYGGPIVGNLLAQRPDLINTAIMIAPVNDPDHEPLKWYSYLAHWKLTKWLLPHGFQVAGDEKFAHAQSLDEIRHNWTKIQHRITHVHGDDDVLAPSDFNIEWSMQHIPSDKLNLVVMKGGHLVLWTEYTTVRSIILEEIAKL